jgi:hypothetical protein
METKVIKGIDNVYTNLIQPKMLRLHSGLAGFDDPEQYSIYRHTGGKPLGTVGAVYAKAGPPNPRLFVDLIRKSLDHCADFLNQDEIEYAELKGGSKIRISIPGPIIEPHIRTKGTIIKSRLDFITGFDGLTKTSLGVFDFVTWCSNGCARWGKDAAFGLAFKNTPGNVGKWALFCDEIVKALEGTKAREAYLNKAATIQYTQKDLDAFFTKVFGYSQKEFTELNTRKRNILDSINACVAIESEANGTNLYSLLGGVTRYTTHEMAGGNLDLLLTDTAATINRDAQLAIAEMMN